MSSSKSKRPRPASYGMEMVWFKAKKYGYGWYPATWQGWLVMIIYVTILVSIFRNIDAGSHSNSDTLIGFFVPWLFTTIGLIMVCIHTGEPARWRWGDHDNKKI